MSALGYSLYLAYKAQHGDKTHSQLGKALAKELAAQRSVSHAVENVFGDAAAGKGEYAQWLSLTGRVFHQPKTSSRMPSQEWAAVGLGPTPRLDCAP